MRYGMFWLASTLSLMLLLVIGRAWNRSYTAPYEGACTRRIAHHQRYFYVLSESGGVLLKSTTDWPTEPTGENQPSWASCRATESWEQPFPHEQRCGRLGPFRAICGEDEFYDDGGGTLTKPGLAISFPYVALIVPLLLLPTLGFARTLRAGWRRRHRRCVGCGNDLRAKPTQCPECGLDCAPARSTHGRCLSLPTLRRDTAKNVTVVTPIFRLRRAASGHL